MQLSFNLKVGHGCKPLQGEEKETSSLHQSCQVVIGRVEHNEMRMVKRLVGVAEMISVRGINGLGLKLEAAAN